MIALKYLDLSWSKINNNVLETLFESCFSLQELSMGNLTLSSEMISSICYQNGQSLRLLDLQLCWGLNLNSIKLIFEKCTELNEVNLNKTNLSEDSINILVNNLTPKVEKLSLWGVFSVQDEHITTLVQRCNRLVVLNLQGTSITNTSITNIIDHQRQSYTYQVFTINSKFVLRLKKKVLVKTCSAIYMVKRPHLRWVINEQRHRFGQKAFILICCFTNKGSSVIKTGKREGSFLYQN